MARIHGKVGTKVIYMSKVLIEAKQVSFQYEKGREILKDISFQINEGESIGLVGANGAGKSTLLKILVGLNLGFTGEVKVGEHILKNKTLPAIREKIGYVFQDSDSQLFMNTAYEDIAFAPRNYGLKEAEVEKRVERALDTIGITYLRDRHTYKMSGGEKKLVSIATILSMLPEIILMDEPSVALDPRNRRNLIRLLNSLDCVKVIASHDLDMILDTCERTILISDGQIIRDGRTKDILTDQELLEKNELELPLSLWKKS